MVDYFKKRYFEKPSKYKFALTAIILTIIGSSIIIIGTRFERGLVMDVIQGIGAGVIGLGLIEVLNEFTVARKVRAQFQILGDLVDKGIDRVCTSDEISDEFPNILRDSKTIKILGIGNKWLLRKETNLQLLEDYLLQGKSAKILIPNPLSVEIIERYKNDEPDTFEQGLDGLAANVVDWYKLMIKYKSLQVKLYDGYPVVNMSVYRNYVFASPILYKRRGINSLTSVFTHQSLGSKIFEKHFDNIFEKDSNDVTDEYISRISNMLEKGLFKKFIFEETDKLKKDLNDKLLLKIESEL